MKRPGGIMRSAVWAVGLTLMASIVLPGVAGAATAQAIDASADKILQKFKETHQGADAALKQAKGVLVFPEIVKAGFIVGGCLLYTSPSPRDLSTSRMPSSA